MAEYIEREMILKEFEGIKIPDSIEYGLASELAVNIIKYAPAADVAPVRHGRWVADCDGISRCSLCWAAAPAEDEDWDRIDSPPYCHNCGAKMDEPLEEE